MQITQSLHTAILVTDLERSEHFYGKVLGLSKIDRSLKYAGTWYQVGNYQIHLIVAPTVPTENPNENGDATLTSLSRLLTWTLQNKSCSIIIIPFNPALPVALPYSLKILMEILLS